MKIGFPYMGVPVGYEKLARMLGHDWVTPPKPTQRTVDLGVKYSPEFACFPLKVLLGTYLECIEMGADTIMSSGGHGPCRAGFYGELHSAILHNLGYNVDMIIFDSIIDNPRQSLVNFKKLKGDNSWRQVWFTLKTTYGAIKALDQMEKIVQVARAYEVQDGRVSQTWEYILKEMAEAMSPGAVAKVKEEGLALLRDIPLVPVSESDKIRIGIVGEIYVVMESGVNLQMEECLGDLGCEVTRSQYLSEWVDYHLLPHWFSKPHEVEIVKKGTEFINIGIGGHARENMGWIKEFAEKGYDGIVHLLPFGCLPELMSQSIIPTVSKNLNIPVLSLSLDEQTGQANVSTRVEAFIDLIKSRKGHLVISNQKKVG